MSETKDTADKTLTGGGRKPLSLQRTVESGHVRQSFSHGRSKSVVVEKRKTRKLTAPGAPAAETSAPTAAPAAPKAETRPAPKTPPRADAGKSDLLRPEERDARARALAEARKQAVVDAQRAAEQQREEAEASRAAAAAAPAQPPAPAGESASAAAPAPRPAATPAPARPAPVERTQRPAGESAGGRPPQRQRPASFDPRFAPREGGRPKQIEIPRPASPPPAADRGAGEVTKIVKEVRARPVAAEAGDDEESRAIKRGGKLVRVPVKAPTTDTKRERGKLTINNALDEQQRERSLASLKRKREREKLKAMGIQQPRDKIVREVVIPEAITIQELSNRMTERGVDVIRFLMKEGAMHKITDVIDADTAELIVTEFGHTPKRVSEADVETGFIGEKDTEDAQSPRAPVVTIMGHVDHGKTSLLDAIRKTNVVSGEAGGITQHIGAYQVSTPSGDKVTFIDTPGHAAFTAMRARGAKVTDIVVLVVAADDGVMPQTVEAINHAKAANVPIIVAINKIDKPAADPKRVQTDLLSHEIVVESMGGETLEVPVSALKGTNLDKLLETIHLQAEVLDLKANPNRSAEGIVIEAKLERGRGPVGTVLVQRGTLRLGDIVVAGTAWGRVRALIDDQGKNVDSAGPSVPVEVLGFDSAPEAGDQIAVVENEARAREITDYRIRKRRETLGSAGTPRTLEQMMQTLKDAAGKKDFTLLIKGDVQGSVEAIQGALKKLGTDEVEARVVHSGVGGITESDVALAGASKAVVVGFNVRANAQAKQAADSQGIELRYYSIIYDLVDDVKAAMSGLLAPTIRENFLGYASIKQVFNISKVGKVAGCIVTEGKVERGAKVRLLRDKVVIHEGTLSILKRFKDDVKEVPAGQECGMAFANYQDIREGDEIECFQVETIQRSL
ncbi:translation initiation factor IF-2 [Hyphomicrobium sp. CS1GBMeth3]|uniref:translation initiation factor IF-2 n=1 Tax=Hyphomicrobium sp. CS1GBMeth3 TaxID=1892845 RepID=UPI000930AD3A|nr:translation initiation factor IF-2 [Hyphomicrobium sp. CS1GBMeth3]